MILLDKNNKPENTVYYIAAISYSVLKCKDGIDYNNLFKKIEKIQMSSVNFEFFALALDFLYLIDKIYIDKKGGLHVFKDTYVK